MKHVLAGVAALSLISCQSTGPHDGSLGSAPRSCSSEADLESVAATVRAFYDALARDDGAAVRGLTTETFYAFEIGKRYSGPELSKLIADAHASGRIMQWNIGTVDARIDCSVAFAAWENVGAAGTAARLEPRAWLESALLVRREGRWRIDMLHSTPKDPRK
ncbi:nuclear transport factor 2 family protein [Sphingomonas parva]|uniref:Nuclear transport factor 2 family protein n=1 Tax=Sphingomonas parva TaxID=2555898 RepID=A0A4Y8ZL31_9SPHN|nr:nuclear transport factor 2 family protein [Sphingomonas parva]TFI56713.1 nuclear transport factor 2 family protein [Sphingomonas parva]